MNTNDFIILLVWSLLMLNKFVPLLAARHSPASKLAAYYNRMTAVVAKKLAAKAWYTVWGTWAVQGLMIMLGLISDWTSFLVVMAIYAVATFLQHKDAVKLNLAAERATAA